jgi:DNA-binding PadR family transcriptional regulator
MSPVFGHGRLRLYLLKLLDEHPRHGYEVIRLLEDRFMGLYAPSAGTVYPRLSRLEAEGLVTHFEADGRKVYRITDAGRDELRRRETELRELEAEIRSSVSDLANEIKDEVRGSVRSLREELRQAVRDVRRQERHASRQERQERRDEAQQEPRERERQHDQQSRDQQSHDPHSHDPHSHHQHSHHQQSHDRVGRDNGAGSELGSELEAVIDRFREQAREVIRTRTVTEAQVQACRSMLGDALGALQRALDDPNRPKPE